MVMTVTKKYHVGVSYANEDQDIVKSVVKALESVGLTVFFDQKEATRLVGKNLTYTLPEIYRNCCEYCLMFVSNSYVSKKWTTYERDWLLDKRIELQRDDILQIVLFRCLLTVWICLASILVLSDLISESNPLTILPVSCMKKLRVLNPI